MKIDIGISEQDRKSIAGQLSNILADSYTLYLKNHNFHWNVTGPMFQTLHLMFEQQYTELAIAVDLIAERIRALGVFAPGTYSDFAKLTSIKEPNGVPNHRDMVQQPVEGHESIIRTAHSARVSTLNLLNQKLPHREDTWLLSIVFEGVQPFHYSLGNDPAPDR